MFRRFLEDEQIVSVLGTVAVHLVLILLFWLIHIRFQPVVEEFARVTISGGWEAPTRLSEAVPEQSETREEAQPAPPESNLPENLQLPERRELALNEEEIVEKVQPEVEKFTPPANITKKSRPVSPPALKQTAAPPAFTKREKTVDKGLFRKRLDEKLLKGTQKVSLNIDRQFEIDWEGEIKREIYQKRLPEFPPDIQREATIKIRFTVLPNGLVGQAVLLQKGDTRLENLTLEAFKTWRFNPLPDYVEQRPQTGVITFHFKLK